MVPTPREPTADAGDAWLVCQVDGAPDEVERMTALVAGVLEDRRLAGPIVVGLQFVDVDQMAELNLAHMGHDGPTDVLSFPIDGDPAGSIGSSRTRPAIGPAPADRPPWLLGDIVICPEVAAANAPGHAGTYDDELALLVVHGLLHLLGMDHATEDEQMVMQARERQLLERLHGPLARDPWLEVAG